MSVLAGLLAAAAAQAALVDVRSDGAAQRTLTIYRDDLAFVTETHVVDLPAGRSRVVFAGVNERMVPQTAVLTAFGGVTLERNFDQTLLAKASLFGSLVGDAAILTRTNPATGTSEAVRTEVLSADRGVVLRTPSGIETLDCTGLPQTLAAPERPAGLLSEPELSVVVEAEAAGPRELTLAYLARGIGWSADYVLTVGEGGAGETAGLRGWLTFTNETADGFDAVPAAIIAGTLRTTGETEAPTPDVPYYYAACWPRGTTTDVPLRRAENPYLLGFPDGRSEYDALGLGGALESRMAAPAPMMAESAMADEIVVTGTRIATEERFGDYRLYRPPGPVTLTPYRTKQVAFLDEGDVAVSRRYDVEARSWTAGDDAILGATAVYLIDNEAGGTLGRALPAGTVRVMTEADGAAFYLGRDEVRDLAVGLPVEIETGTAPDVTAKLRWEGRRGNGRDGGYRYDVTVRFANALASPAPVRFTLPGWRDELAEVEIGGGGRARVEGEASPTWDVTVPANGTRDLRLTIAYKR